MYKTVLTATSSQVKSPLFIAEAQAANFLMPESISSIIKWLYGIRADIHALTQTPEYNAFLHAFQNLKQAHKNVATARTEIGLEHYTESILQYILDDDVALRICEFLNCQNLITWGETCTRFHALCNTSAKQKTAHINDRFYLQSHMKLLRAKEQTEGILPHCRSVRVPLLGLEKKLIVSESGDPDYNGVYFCTGSNGNGYLFSKPRFNCIGWNDRENMVRDDFMAVELGLGEEAHGRRTRRRIIHGGEPDKLSTVNVQGEEIFPESNPDRFPRCIISKRFSDENILWYMSKEVETEGDGEVRQEFSFWAKLMVAGEGSPELCRYPSQTSVVSMHGDSAWHSLSRNRTTAPPTVELLD